MSVLTDSEHPGNRLSIRALLLAIGVALVSNAAWALEPDDDEQQEDTLVPAVLRQLPKSVKSRRADIRLVADQVPSTPVVPFAVIGPQKNNVTGDESNRLGKPTNQTKAWFNISVPALDGNLVAIFEDSTQVTLYPQQSVQWYELALDIVENQGESEIKFQWTAARKSGDPIKPATTVEPMVVKVNVDTKGPRIELVTLMSEKADQPVLVVRFEEADLNTKTILRANFKIRNITEQPNGTTATSPDITNAVIDEEDPRNVLLTLSAAVAPGNYELKLAASSDAAGVRDMAGNVAGGNGDKVSVPQKATFSVYPDTAAITATGKHIEFPRYVPTTEFEPDRPFNPGDHVETRVARMFNRRDAHRVAQIINRNVQSHKAAAVTMAQRDAQGKRNAANETTDERRSKEREAIRKATEARAVERQLAAARATLEQARAVLGGRTQNANLAQSAVNNSPQPASTDDQATKDEKAAQNERLNTALNSAKASMATAQNAVNDAATNVTQLEQQAASARSLERNAQEESFQSEAREERARENAFRAEVAAASADPDTYVPGNIHSSDPVSQVSISVLGEGVMQLRGPITGINEIRTMIHQMDMPLGQVKVGIHTVQINGEHEDKMEKVAGRIEGYIDLSRFMTAQSLMLLRRAIQEEAAQIAESAGGMNGHRQVDRDRKYLYGFFGRDFIDELYAMDSEFLRSGNKLLSLHSMDTISLSKGLFIISLARNDVRQNILARFMSLVESELPQAEYDFRKANNLLPKKGGRPKDICKRATEQYRFRSIRGYFDSWVADPDTMTPMQREFIRLAQIFKAQMVAEVEIKQRVVERGLIQDNANDEVQRASLSRQAHAEALQQEQDAQKQLIESNQAALRSNDVLFSAMELIDGISNALQQSEDSKNQFKLYVDKIAGIAGFEGDDAPQRKVIDTLYIQGRAITLTAEPSARVRDPNTGETFIPISAKGLAPVYGPEIHRLRLTISRLTYVYKVNTSEAALLRKALEICNEAEDSLNNSSPNVIGDVHDAWEKIEEFIDHKADVNTRVKDLSKRLEQQELVTHKIAFHAQKGLDAPERQLMKSIRLKNELVTLVQSEMRGAVVDSSVNALNTAKRSLTALQSLESARANSDGTRSSLDHRKMLNFLIDEQTEKYIELLEATRGHISVVDNHIKRLITALEDDIKVQFYDPAFVEVRTAGTAGCNDVTFGQIERTTVLTNNRQLGKVSPQATMEFDLPKRDIMITEAMRGAQAIVEEHGTLLQDPTFLGLTAMLSGSPAVAGIAPGTSMAGLPGQGLGTPAVRSVLPGLSTSSQETLMAESGGPQRKFGAAFDKLIPDPAVYKFETGTAFEIRPVIQADGDAVVYDFNYLYRTHVREPVRADEKHLGRVKEHYINTQVQSSTFELREISRYVVALRAVRTGRGVPLLEDVPGVGVMFRPLPNAESSLQENIVLGHSVAYPTLFDLMGLRWAPAAVDLDHDGLRDLEHVTRGRRQIIRNYTFDEASENVDRFLDLPNREQKGYQRPDLYRQQSLPSPYHPRGYVKEDPDQDPTGQKFELEETRPEEFQEPQYDRHHRREVHPEEVPPGIPLRSGPGPDAFDEIAPGRRTSALPSPARKTERMRRSDTPIPATDNQESSPFLPPSPSAIDTTRKTQKSDSPTKIVQRKPIDRSEFGRLTTTGGARSTLKRSSGQSAEGGISAIEYRESRPVAAEIPTETSAEAGVVTIRRQSSIQGAPAILIDRRSTTPPKRVN